MKLGISHASYYFIRNMQFHLGNLNYYFEMTDVPTRYFEPYPVDFYDWFIQRAIRYRKTRGLHGVRMEVPESHLDDEDYIRNLGKLLSENGLTVTHYESAGLYYEHPSVVKEAILPQVRKHMEAAEKLHARVFAFADGPPPNYWHRYRTPDLERRIERTAVNLEQCVDEGSAYSFIMAVENHGDYRVDETLEIIRRAGGDNVMINFDPTNAAIVMDDPVQAVNKIADRTVMTHLKDFEVIPTYYGSRFVGVPLGKGIIDYEAILQVLHDKAPDRNNLSLNVETLVLEGDEDEAVDESLRFLSEDMKRFLD